MCLSWYCSWWKPTRAYCNGIRKLAWPVLRYQSKVTQCIKCHKRICKKNTNLTLNCSMLWGVLHLEGLFYFKQWHTVSVTAHELWPKSYIKFRSMIPDNGSYSSSWTGSLERGDKKKNISKPQKLQPACWYEPPNVTKNKIAIYSIQNIYIPMYSHTYTTYGYKTS